VFTTMFLHETSRLALPKILAEVQRVMAPGALSVHLEQPQYQGMDVYEQFIRDWDAYNNNEPFWTTMHDLDLVELVGQFGVAREQCFESATQAVLDPELFPAAAAAQAAAKSSKAEDYGRKAAWYVFGTRAA
jgi:hypothetical protein